MEIIVADQIIMGLILNAGDAKQHIYQALSYAKEGDFTSSEDEIAKAEGVEVTPEDMNYEIFAMSQQFGADPKEVYDIIVKEGRVSMLASSVARKKAARFIIENAKGAEKAE